MDELHDRIEIKGLRAFGHHGVFDSERVQGQTFLVDVSLEVDLTTAASTDDLGHTVDYGRLATRIAGEVEATRFDLIEALAAHLAEVALEHPLARAVTVRVAKPGAPVEVDVEELAVVVRRARNRVPPDGRAQP